MSKISTVIDKILVKLGEEFQGKTRIPNAYSLTDNNKKMLTNGYGLIVGSASYEPLEFCSFNVSRTFTVVFTKEIYKLESSFAETDVAVKDLLESVVATQKLFYSYEELGIDEQILKVDIGSVSGVETIINDKQNFLSMTAEFQFQIMESIS